MVLLSTAASKSNLPQAQEGLLILLCKTQPFTQLFQMWCQRPHLFPLSTTPNQTQLHRVLYAYAVDSFRNNSVLKSCLAQLPSILKMQLHMMDSFPFTLETDSSSHRGWIIQDKALVKLQERSRWLKAIPELKRQYHIPENCILYICMVLNNLGVCLKDHHCDAYFL